MGFLMDGLDAEEYDRTYGDRELVRRILSYFRPHVPDARRGSDGRADLAGADRAADLHLVFAGPAARRRLDRGVLEIAAVVMALGVVGWAFNAVRRWLSAEAIGNVVLHYAKTPLTRWSSATCRSMTATRPVRSSAV